MMYRPQHTRAYGCAMIDGWRVIAKRRKEAERQQRRDEYVKKVVAAAPPLTPEQLDRIAALLRAGRRG